MNDDVRELIAEARRYVEDIRGNEGWPDDDGLPAVPTWPGMGRVFGELCDALEATLQPVDPVALADVIGEHSTHYTRFPHTYEAWHGCSCGERYLGDLAGRGEWHRAHQTRKVVEWLKGQVE